MRPAPEKGVVCSGVGVASLGKARGLLWGGDVQATVGGASASRRDLSSRRGWGALQQHPGPRCLGLSTFRAIPPPILVSIMAPTHSPSMSSRVMGGNCSRSQGPLHCAAQLGVGAARGYDQSCPPPGGRYPPPLRGSSPGAPPLARCSLGKVAPGTQGASLASQSVRPLCFSCKDLLGSLSPDRAAGRDGWHRLPGWVIGEEICLLLFFGS